MKLIIQIPCFNEEKTLAATINDLPKKIEGIDAIEVLVINDGSTDGTIETARRCGVRHVVNMPSRKGLAGAFRAGIERSLQLGADIIVNTDGDNQYRGEDLASLVKPILAKKADMVIGCRDISAIKHFSPVKKLLQLFGSYIVRKFSKTSIPDVTSGFRAYSGEAALRLNIFSNYTYTIETIIQAGRKGMSITHVNIRTNEKTRPSRLFRSVFEYIWKSTASILRIYLLYEPLKAFFWLAAVVSLPGIFLMIRFLHSHFTKAQGGHVQSLIIAAMFFIISFSTLMLGLIGDILSKNRVLAEDILYRIKKREQDKGAER